MKRKFFTSLAAAGILSCAIVTASAAPASDIPHSPFRNCWWQQIFCGEIQPPADGNLPVIPEQPTLPDNGTDSESSGTMHQLEQAACNLINQRRAAHGLQPLTISSELSTKARVKSKDMKDNGYFSHNSPTYGSPFQMMQTLGITYRSAAENIAMGYNTAEAVVNAWMNSESHRANILSDRYTTVGIGYVDGYWTQWFIG